MKKRFVKKPSLASNLDRFRNEVVEFAKKGGLSVHESPSAKTKTLSRKHKRKLERKLKGAKKQAFFKKQEMPTLESFAKLKTKKSKKSKAKKVDENGEKIEKAYIQPEPGQTKSTLEMLENQLIQERNQFKQYEKSTEKTKKKKLIEDNEDEDKEIKRLEKLLHIKKSSKVPKSFFEEGLDELLDFCDEKKRKKMLKKEENIWLGGEGVGLGGDESESEEDEKTLNKRDRIAKLNKDLKKSDDDDSQDDEDRFSDSEFEDEYDNMDDDEFEDGADDFFEKPGKKKVKFEEEETDGEYEEGDEEMYEDGSIKSEEGEDIVKKDLKEDIYGRLIDKQGKVVTSEKYVPPAQRLRQLNEQNESSNSLKLTKLSKQVNGLLNRLSTSNINTIANQIMQIFYSNEYSRYDLTNTLYKLIDVSVFKTNCLTPQRLLVEHACLIHVLTANVGIEVGATILQKMCNRINESSEEHWRIENKLLDNLILFLCDFYNFKLVSSNLIVDFVKTYLSEKLTSENLDKLEKLVELILLVLRSVGFTLRKDSPIELKDLIVQLQSNINTIKAKLAEDSSSEAINSRLKFMIESINAIKNNDIRRIDSFDQQPIEHLRKQTKMIIKEDSGNYLLNVSFKDLVSANELGRWWIVGSAWNLKERNQDSSTDQVETSKTESSKSVSNSGMFSEKILKLAREQHMNTDVRRAVFCIIISAEDYTDAFMKLVKLSLKKQQEREIIYIIFHCVLMEKTYNPYYSYLMQKFCEYDRRFKMTLQFHTWDKFKLLHEMSKQQIVNFANLYVHLISTGAMSLSVLKNVEFGEMNKFLLQYLREFLTTLVTKLNRDQIQEAFLKITAVKKLHQLRNALKLFVVHFVLTDKGKEIELDDKLREKFEFVRDILSASTD